MQVNFTINIDDRLVKKVKNFFSRRNTIIVSTIGAMAVSAIIYAQTTSLNVFSTGQTIYAEDINNNFAFLNQQIQALQNQNTVFFTGMIMPFIGSDTVNNPEGWVICDGRVIPDQDSGGAGYDLAVICGKTGTSDGVAPDLRGRFLIGYLPQAITNNSDARYQLGDDSETSWIRNIRNYSSTKWNPAISISQMPSHDHTYTDKYRTVSSLKSGRLGTSGSPSTDYDHSYMYCDTESTDFQLYTGSTDNHVNPTGGTDKFPIIPPSYTVIYIIKM